MSDRSRVAAVQTYFTGEFSARRPATIVAGVVMTIIGLSLAAMWGPQMKLALLPQTLGALAFIFVWLGGGLFFLYKIATKHKTVLAITSAGISYGSKVYRWEDLTEIGIMQKYTRRNDLFCTTKLHPFVVELLLSHGLTEEQIGTVFGALHRAVAPIHPHLRLARR